MSEKSYITLGNIIKFNPNQTTIFRNGKTIELKDVFSIVHFTFTFRKTFYWALENLQKKSKVFNEKSLDFCLSRILKTNLIIPWVKSSWESIYPVHKGKVLKENNRKRKYILQSESGKYELNPFNYGLWGLADGTKNHFDLQQAIIDVGVSINSHTTEEILTKNIEELIAMQLLYVDSDTEGGMPE